ncbi:origin recognition complex subunit 2-like [Rhagoletis pomonella]|uniref:origin recognition complex subunit 2-like n=1 Tax=Rhagoletis pomonella TaxID=28610 RepID=UPI00177B061D|nr:origin recognition complex subunit 2-like [Rhagoletis pomonella]
MSASKTGRPRRTSARLSSTEDVLTVTAEDSDDEKQAAMARQPRRSSRKVSPHKKYADFVPIGSKQRKRRQVGYEETDEDTESEDENYVPPSTKRPDIADIQLLQDEEEVVGKNMYGFHTPKKRNGMALAAMNTPKTPKTPKTPMTPKTPKTSRLSTSQPQTKTPVTKRRKSTAEPKTPSHLRQRVKNQIAKLMDSDSDFSASGSDFVPTDSDSSSSSSSDDDEDTAADGGDDEPKTPHKSRRPIVVPVLPKTPSAARARQSARAKKSSVDYVPEKVVTVNAAALTGLGNLIVF